jgi:hypothetical protein
VRNLGYYFYKIERRNKQKLKKEREREKVRGALQKVNLNGEKEKKMFLLNNKSKR